MSNSLPKGISLKASDFQISGNNVFINKSKIKNKPGMLLIYATWCGHCHRFLPTFNDIHRRIGNDFCCASIESEELDGKDRLVSALNFQGYPTICFFDQHGLIVEQYNGKRDTGSILNQVCEVYHHCVTRH
jgi:thiol-disulfide isomerase/thioredoxin